jgi:hypothetical protein
MIRTQVQLTDRQIKGLKQVAAVTGRPVADLVVEAVDQSLIRRNETWERRVMGAITLAGRFSSGRSDVSANHERHFAEAIRQATETDRLPYKPLLDPRRR